MVFFPLPAAVTRRKLEARPSIIDPFGTRGATPWPSSSPAVRGTEDFLARLRDDNPPDVDGTRYTDMALRALYPSDDGSTIELGDEHEIIADKYLTARGFRLEAEKEEKKYKQHLRAAMGESLWGRLPDGRRIKCQTVNSKGYTVGASQYRKLSVLGED